MIYVVTVVRVRAPSRRAASCRPAWWPVQPPSAATPEPTAARRGTARDSSTRDLCSSDGSKMRGRHRGPV